MRHGFREDRRPEPLSPSQRVMADQHQEEDSGE